VTKQVFLSAGSGSLSNYSSKGLAHGMELGASMDNAPVFSTGPTGTGEGVRITFNSQGGFTDLGQGSATAHKLTIEISGVSANNLMLMSTLKIKGRLFGVGIGEA
jgi:hypothetical protein